MGARDQSAYAGRTIALATNHGKEAAMAPVFLEQLGARIVAVPGGPSRESFDGGDDVFALSRARASFAADTSGEPLALATAVTFETNRLLPVFTMAIERAVFIDRELGGEVRLERRAERSNFAEATASDPAALEVFLKKVQFPAQAIAVRPNAGPDSSPVLGIRDRTELDEAVRQCTASSPDGLARITTDMRAAVSNWRRESLRQLAERISDRLRSLCPKCHSPGWGIAGGDPGLPCAKCGAPTPLLCEERYGCMKCDYTFTFTRADGLEVANPAHCPHCNKAMPR